MTQRYRVTMKWLFLGLCFAFLFSGCSLWNQILGKEEEKSPEDLMEEGMKELKRGYYESATETFQKLKDRYPYSKYAVTAELKMADTLYIRRLFDEAFDAYSEFERLHPKNRNIPYVIYQRGMCHFSQVSTIDRDQSHTLLAKEEFERLIKRYPRSEYANRARKKIRECYMKLADYELYVAHFYFKQKKYRAALGRYQYILDHYPDLGQYHVALEYIAKCKEKLAEQERETRKKE